MGYNHNNDPKRKEQVELSLTDTVKFSFRCAILMAVVNIGFGLLVPLLMNVIVNVVPDNGAQLTIGSENVQSFAAWFVVTAVMCWVLWADDRKNTAYAKFDLFSALICAALMFMLYFAPVIFMRYATDIAEKVLAQYFITSRWLLDILDNDYTQAVLAGGLMTVAVIMLAYFTSHAVYLEKHPDA